MAYIDYIEEKLVDRDDLIRPLTRWRVQDQQIVFTNGCFDVLHQGHIHLLASAADMGDKLIVGLNSDVSIKQIKGSDRPINDERTREMVLASLLFVDAVVLFDEQTPYELISRIQPQVLVKGGDYKKEEIIGADIVLQHGGSVEIIPYLDGYSTTAIISKQ